MQIIPERIQQIIQSDKSLNLAISDIEYKIENIVKDQPPIFFQQYTDHGINHFIDTLKMAIHLIDNEDLGKMKDQKAVIDRLSPLNSLILTASILFHDLGMHIHFKGFQQLISGFFDDVRIDFFDDLTWKQEWDNYMIEAKRFSGRERINLFGDEQVIIKDIDFTKPSIDSDIQKNLIGEFIRRHHGRLAHEIAIKGFPVQDKEVIVFASNLKAEFKDIIGLISRSHSLKVREAMGYVEEIFPADPHTPYEIEIPFLMCILRIADYFQFDSNRSNAFLIKLQSFTSPFSFNEHRAHLSTEYFRTDENDPESLFVDVKPKDGLMYVKLTRLFDNIQRELDTSFAIIGEMYGRRKEYLRLRFRRIKSNLKNRKVIGKLSYMPGEYHFEADTDLFKLLVGPLYGYDASYGVRELIQNAIDACVELGFKSDESYSPLIEINVDKNEDQYSFSIRDNGKGMSIGEIKNYFLKAGASFRNSTEWKIDYQTEENTPIIRRTGKFGIGVLASFLIGESIEVTTRRYNESIGYFFKADLTNQFIEINKNGKCEVGTTITIKMDEKTYKRFCGDDNIALTGWYALSYPKINYFIDKNIVEIESSKIIQLVGSRQVLNDAVELNFTGFDSIIWGYKETGKLLINGIQVPDNYYYPSYNRHSEEAKKKKNIYDELERFPFISILDRNNLIDLELNRNSIRGHLPFIKELVESCKLDFIFKLIFFNCPVIGDTIDISTWNEPSTNDEYMMELDTFQFRSNDIFSTKEGYFLNHIFYAPINKELDYYKIFSSDLNKHQIKIIDNSICTLTHFWGIAGEQNILRGDYRHYLTICKPNIYLNNFESRAITGYVRERIEIVTENKDYIIFTHGGFKLERKEKLIKLFIENNAEAVQLIDRSLRQEEELNKLLKAHIISPKLIPYNFEEKKKYAKTLSAELQKHIEERRGINL